MEVYENGAFFNNEQGVREYDAEDLSVMFAGIAGSNIVGGDDDLKPTINLGGTGILVAPGFVMIDGKGKYISESIDIPIPENTSGYVVAALNLDLGKITIGTSSTIEDTQNVKFFPIAQYSRVITTPSITDMRKTLASEIQQRAKIPEFTIGNNPTGDYIPATVYVDFSGKKIYIKKETN